MPNFERYLLVCAICMYVVPTISIFIMYRATVLELNALIEIYQIL